MATRSHQSKARQAAWPQPTPAAKPSAASNQSHANADPPRDIEYQQSAQGGSRGSSPPNSPEVQSTPRTNRMPPSYPNSFRGFSDVPGTLRSTSAANADSPRSTLQPKPPRATQPPPGRQACWKHRRSHTKAQARVACLQPAQKPCPSALYQGPVHAGRDAEPACVACLCKNPKACKACSVE